MELKDNTIIVVLGASGDLAKKKTVSFHPDTWKRIPKGWSHVIDC